MKMLKVLLKVAKFYAIADSVAGLFTQLYLNSVNHDCRCITKTFGITIDDSKDEEDHLEILDVNNAKTA